MTKNNPNILEVDLVKIANNLQKIKKQVGSKTEIMPVVKASGYGSYLNKFLEIFEEQNINKLAVATVDEGVYLRKLGFIGEIIVLNQPLIETIASVLKYDLVVGICRLEYLIKLNEKSKKLNKYSKIHLEIDTGMGRTGVNIKDLNKFLDLIPTLDNVELDGLYTHFASSEDKEKTQKQLNIFEEAISKIKAAKIQLKYIHAANSGAIFSNTDTYFNLVRPGLIIYGYPENSNMNLEPSLKLSSKISFLKETLPNTPISYNGTFVTKSNTIIATVPIGYADGIKRNLSNKGEVLVKNTLCPIIGNICMDSLLIDVTKVNEPKVGDIVYFFDNNKILLSDMAKEADTICYEIIANISDRVERNFIR